MSKNLDFKERVIDCSAKLLAFLNRPYVFLTVFILCGILFAMVFPLSLSINTVLWYFLGVLIFLIPICIRVSIFEYLGAKDVKIVDYSKEVSIINSILKEYKNLTNIELKPKIKNIKKPNLYVLGSNLYVTRGLIENFENFTVGEIKAAIGHEIAHKKEPLKDFLYFFLCVIIVIILVGGILLFLDLNTQYAKFPIYFLIYIIFFWFLRRDEYKADEGSVKLGNKKQDLISILKKLEKLWKSEDKKYHKFWEHVDNLLNTHPRVEDRIKE